MPTTVAIDQIPTPASSPVEVVERKGLGHPDTLADALAERMSVAYARHTREQYGAALHHNLDKLWIQGGHARTGLGEFEMTAPTRVVIGGRASSSFADTPIDYRGLFEQVARDYFATVLPHFDAERWLTFEHATTDRSRYPTWFKPRDLGDLPELTEPVGSDTVAVTAWWPNTPTEQLVLALERHLNQEGAGPLHPHVGQDVKVMAVRRGPRIDVVVNAAIHPDTARTAALYDEVLADLTEELAEVAAKTVPDHLDTALRVNTQSSNPHQAKRHYLLGSGTCLEFGEEGFVGRGNGASGLIPVHRPKSVEAVFGKNPTYHSGKVYTLYAEQIARRVHDECAVAASVTIVSGNSDPLREPAHAAVTVDGPCDTAQVQAITRDVLAHADHLALAIDDGLLIPR